MPLRTCVASAVLVLWATAACTPEATRSTPEPSQPPAISPAGTSPTEPSQPPATSPTARPPATSPAATTPAATTGPQLPEGWRWESYGGVQVGVPGEWGWGNAAQRVSQWCISRPRDLVEPIVGRPGAPVTLVGCFERRPGPPPDTLVAETGEVVLFSPVIEDRPERDRGDRTTVRIGDVEVLVQARQPLRDRIAATVHRVRGTDVSGCPLDDPAAADPARRPADPVDVGSLSGVEAVAVCKYALPEVDAEPHRVPPLVSSLRLEGAAARRVVAAVAEAPRGGGPDNPGDCLPEYSYGDEVIVLRIEASQGGSTVQVRYSGCDHNGFDDGVTVRRLTRQAVQPLIAGPNQVFSWSGRAEKRRIMQP